MKLSPNKRVTVVKQRFVPTATSEARTAANKATILSDTKGPMRWVSRDGTEAENAAKKHVMDEEISRRKKRILQ
jgi:hypothetical protein